MNGTTANRIASWDGSNWAALSLGMNGKVNTLTVFDGKLIFGGGFSTVGSITANRIASWDGSNWAALGAGLNNTVYALTVFDGKLIAGGVFLTAGSTTVNNIASWDGSSWAELGSGMGSSVNTLTVFDGKLIAGGGFRTAGSTPANFIASWDGNNWSALGSGLNSNLSTLTVFDGKLIVGGGFNTAGGITANNIASWDGSNWAALGSGMDGAVRALAVFNGQLIAGGGFNKANGVTVNCIARWDGNNWSALGSGLNATVYALSVFDAQLIAGGSFAMAGGITVNRIANWNGSNWSALGSGMDGDVIAFSAFDGKLIVGGNFSTAGDKFSPYLAKLVSSPVKLTFDSQGGSEVVALSGTVGQELTLPADPAREHYTFAGWNSVSDGTGTDYGKAGNRLTLPAGGLTLYAQWTANAYTISFDSAGGTAVDPIRANFGAAVTAPAAPTKAGYQFAGWSPAMPGTMPAADTKLTAQWTANAYTISFDSAGGSDVLPISANFGVAVTAPTAPTKEGYTFAGWSPAMPGTMPAADTKLTAQWTANAYTISFDSAGGSDVLPISANFGVAVTAPTAPTKEGYTFAGWSPAMPQTMPAANTRVTAQWTVNSYSISFDSAGGSEVAAISANFGTAVTAPSVPTKEGYTFAGWSPAVPGTMPAANTTVTAQWTVNSYSISFDSAGGSAVDPISADFAAAVTAPTAPTKEGYTFAGWSPAVPQTMPAANTRVTAQWTVNAYTITFDSAGGSAVDPISADFAAAVTVPTAPTKEGYTFAGWSPAVPSTMPAANTRVTAQWTVNSYSISFDSAGGSEVAPISADFGTAVTAPTAPTKEGYTFAGWSPAVPSTMPAANTRVTAQWTVNSYSISFDSAGGSEVAPISADFGAAVTAPANPVREGYTFAGWSPAVPQTMPAANTIVTAQWTVNSYSITFNSAGGSEVAPISADFGAAVTAPANPVREGYTFAGWSPAVPSTMPATNSTLTAQWTVNAYSITFDSAGGSAVAPISADFAAAVTAPADPTREGYTFAGWSPAVPSTMPATNSTLTAQWTVNAYSITFDSAGGSAVAPISADFAAAVTAPADPTREGYTFAGWTPSVPATMPATNTTLTAQWTVNSYTISFESDGGSAVAPISANFGAAVTAPTVPTKEGYTFAGWSPALPATMPAQDLTLTALYEQIQLTVTTTVTGEATISPATQQVNYGSTATVALNLVNPDDIVVLAGSCVAAISAGQIQTAAVTEACTIAVTVYPFTEVEKDTEAALASNGTSRFSFVSGAGRKTLLSATVRRAGVESELELAAAEALLSLQQDGSYIFRAEQTGRYTLEFVDTVSGELVQVVYNVLPYLAFTSSQQPVQPDMATNVRVWLSDEPVDYPVTAAVFKDGVSAEMQQIELTQQHQLLRMYAVKATAATARLILQESGISNALLGTPALHHLAIQQQAPALALTATAMQNGDETHVIAQNAGVVSLAVSELHATAATYRWTATGLTLNTSGATASFDPATLAEGRYTITVTAQAENGRTGQYDLALRVIAACPVENCTGVGSSGIPAAQNQVAATPNRLPLCPEVIAGNRVGTCQLEASQRLYAEAPNQYQLTLGALAEQQSWSTGQFGIALNDASLKDTGFVQQGVVINFDVQGLENPGEVVPVAIPLPVGTTIPADAVWRKFIKGRWQNFVVDAANRIDSAARDVLGQCPGVSSDHWVAGLTAGHGCVRLTIQDGGPNDDDGITNSVIRDPGVLAVAEVVVPPKPQPVPAKDVSVKSGGSMSAMLSLLLGAIVVFRMRKLAVAVATVLPLSASAQDLYLGADLMSVGSETSSAQVTAAMHAKGVHGTAVVDDQTRAGVRLYAGHRFADAWSVELGYLDAGDMTTQFTGVPANTKASDLASVWPTSGAGVELSLLWQPVTVAELLKPGLRLGVWQMEMQDRFFDATAVTSHSQSQAVPFAELQGELKLTADWSLKLGVSYYDVDHAEMKTAQFGLIRRF